MPARFWLAKSEPDAYSIDDLARDRVTSWTGVRNYAARNNLRAMRKGDTVVLYHSNADPSACVGEATVARTAYPDPTAFDPKDDMYDGKGTPAEPVWDTVDLRFATKWKSPVPLEAIKREPKLAKMVLLRISRLSVQPLTAAEYHRLARMGGA